MIKIFSKRHCFNLIALLLLVQGLFLFHSCAKPVVTPAYIHIDSLALLTNPGQDGSNSHNIPDAWVYVDNQLVGAFELPATIPLPYNGTHTVQVSAGIKINGSVAERESYPFFKSWNSTMNLLPGARTVLKPVVSYAAYAHPFLWIESFETAGTSLIDTLVSDTIMRKDSVQRYEGHFSGSAYLDGMPGKVPGTVHQRFQCQSAQTFIHNYPDEVVYLEINFKCNTKFYVGLINMANYNSTQYFFFSPTDVWKKTYVRLSDALAGVPIGTGYKVYFGMVKDLLLPVSEMHIDNIKLIH
jgi:hypothetical protein